MSRLLLLSLIIPISHMVILQLRTVTLFAVRDQILDHWLAPEFYEEYVAKTKCAA